MQRPNIIVQVAASVDGRISLGPNRTMFDEMGDPRTDNNMWEQVENRIKELHNPEVDMLGSNSLVKEGAELKQLPEYKVDNQTLFSDYLPENVINRKGHQGWLVIVDGRGRIRSGLKESPDRPGWHTLHFVSNNVSPEYLAFLQDKNIPYLISGEERVDLEKCMAKLKGKLGVNNIVTTSGGKLAGALMRKGLIDEVNLIIKPRIIGGFNTPTLFDSPDLGPEESPLELNLVSTKVKKDGYLWLRYKIK